MFDDPRSDDSRARDDWRERTERFGLPGPGRRPFARGRPARAVRGVLRAGDELLRVEQLAVRAGAHLVHDRRFEVQEHRAGDVLARSDERDPAYGGVLRDLALAARRLGYEGAAALATSERFALEGALVWHRVGMMSPGDPIVLVATAARHRRDAFAAAECLMDHLKSAAWLWKREKRADGWHWIEPREQDHRDRERWK